MRSFVGAAWAVLASTIFMTACFGPQPAAGLREGSAISAFSEIKERARDEHHDASERQGYDDQQGANADASAHRDGADNELAVMSSLDNIWLHARSLGQELPDYATSVVEEAAKDVEPAAAEKMKHVISTLRTVVSDTEKLKHMIAQAAPELSFDEVKDGIARILTNLLEVLREEQTSSHSEPRDEAGSTCSDWGKWVSSVLFRAMEEIINFMAHHGVSEDELRAALEPIVKGVEVIVTALCEFSEQHPILFQALWFYVIALVIPESWLLGRLFRLFGMSPEGPVKGSAFAWAQRTFFGGRIPKGSWFSYLQRAGMKAGRLDEPIWKTIGAGVVAIMGSFWAGGKNQTGTGQ